MMVAGWKDVEATVRLSIDGLIREHPVLTLLPRSVKEEAAYRASLAITRAPTWNQMVSALARSTTKR